MINPETGLSVPSPDGGRLSLLDFQDQKIAEEHEREKGGSRIFTALWQADRDRIQRTAPLDFISRYMKGWWDYAIADELHQLAGETAQGNGLGVLYRCARKQIGLTGTLMGGYADDLFNIFYRMEPSRMVEGGFAAGGQGRRDFQAQYGVLETIEKVREADNACSRAAKRSVQVIRKPGASPLLFGKFLMESTAFITLEDISDQLPSYDETVIQVEMDSVLAEAYTGIEEEIREALEQHRGNKSLMSIMLNTLLLYPDHPYGIDAIWGKQFDPQQGCRVPFLVTVPPQLSETETYAKERRLLEDVRRELSEGRRCQVYATYTGQRGRHSSHCEGSRAGGHQSCGAKVIGHDRQARALVRETTQGGCRGRCLPSEARGDGPRFIEFPDALFLRDGILIAYASAGKPAFVAYRPD